MDMNEKYVNELNELVKQGHKEALEYLAITQIKNGMVLGVVFSTVVAAGIGLGCVCAKKVDELITIRKMKTWKKKFDETMDEAMQKSLKIEAK